MRPASWWVFGGTMLAAGLFLGRACDLGLARRAEAKFLSPEEAAGLAHDLEQSGQPLVSGSDGLAKVAKLMTASVVHIESRHPNGRSGTVEETGSGVILTLRDAPGHYVVTNRHVVAGARDLSGISVQLDDGRYFHPVKAWEDQRTDVAVLRLPEIAVTPARWGDSDAVEIGNFVLALGSPFGLSQSVSLGIVSAKGRRSLELGTGSEMLNQDFLQTDAAINPGNSGGPLVDLHGRVIGINTAIASNSGGNEGIAFSIPSNLVRRVAETLVKHGRVPRSYLGVKLDPAFNAETATKFRLDRLRGAHVLQVYENTPAARAALQKDDIVLHCNGIEVQDQNHLINLVSLTPIGQKVRLGVLRSGRLIGIEVLLADRTELDGHSSAPTDLPAEYQSRVRPTGRRSE